MSFSRQGMAVIRGFASVPGLYELLENVGAGWDDLDAESHPAWKYAKGQGFVERRNDGEPALTVDGRNILAELRKMKSGSRLLRKRTARDEVYETKRGDRWKVIGHSPKGRVIVKRAGHRYEGELQWSPEVLKRMKKVHAAEERVVEHAVAPVMQEEKPGLFAGIGNFFSPVAPDPDGRRRQRIYVIVAEKMRGRKRLLHITLARSAKAKCCSGCLRRRDLQRMFYTVKNARRAQYLMARALRRPGVVVKVS